MESENMIYSQDASLVYMDQGREIFAVNSVNIEIAEGEFVGILGPSGSGKSSLLYLLSGLKTPSSGEIVYQSKTLNAMNDLERAQIRLKDFGFVFQYPYLLGYLSALENIVAARPDQPSEDEAKRLLEALGLGAKSHRYPHEMSGGERQRVCVARALLGSPKIIFADEPTASLDHTNGIQVVSMLNDFRGDGALIMVTHDESMLENADRIIRIDSGIIKS